MPRSNLSEGRSNRTAVRLAAPALAVALVVTGCVHRKEPGLSIAGLESSIVFGLKPVPVVAPPGANAPPITPVSDDAPPTDDIALPEIPVVPPAKPVVQVPKAEVPFCRVATLNDFPTTASLGAPNPPKAGIYRFKPTPPENFSSDRYNVTPADLQARVITNVSEPQRSTNQLASAQAPVGQGQQVTTTVYQYDQFTLLDNSGKNAIVDRIRVTDNPVTQTITANGIAGGGAGPTYYAGGADRGVALIARQVVQNGATGVFVPSSPLLLLPLPAVSGQTWQSVAADPVSGATYVLYGRIVNRQRVDACGDVIEGWAVEAQTVFRDPRVGTVQNANFRYFVDTVNGGQIIYEQVAPIQAPANPVRPSPLDGAFPAAPELPENAVAAPKSEMSLARKNPEPLPAK